MYKHNNKKLMENINKLHAENLFISVLKAQITRPKCGNINLETAKAELSKKDQIINSL